MADDSPKLLSAVGDLVRSRRGMEWAGVAADAENVLAALPAARPDVVLLDVSMPGAAESGWPVRSPHAGPAPWSWV